MHTIYTLTVIAEWNEYKIGINRKRMQQINWSPACQQLVNKFERVQLRSVQIMRPEYNTTQYCKHDIAFFLDDNTTPTQWKSIRKICNKFQSQVHQSWKPYSCNSSSKQAKRKEKLYIIRQKYEKEMLRELKLNPALKVVIWCRHNNLQKYKDTKVCFVSPFFQEIQTFLLENRGLLDTCIN